MTMTPAYEAAQLRIIQAMHAQHMLYRRRKPVFWSPSALTALAEAELEYHDHVSTAAHVLVPVTAREGSALHNSQHRLMLLMWTTTPWTLPANRAVAYNPKLTYCLLDARVKDALCMHGNVRVITGLDTLESIRPIFDHCEVLMQFKGDELEGFTAQHPFFPNMFA